MIHYRCFKSFDKSTFETELKDNLSNIENISFENFYSIFRCTLDKHAPNKLKKVRFNNKRFMSKFLCKAIMTRSRVRNKFNKCRTLDNWKDYTKQRNICTNILRKNKKNIFDNIINATSFPGLLALFCCYNPYTQKAIFWKIRKVGGGGS